MTGEGMTPERAAQNLALVRALAEGIERAWSKYDHNELNFPAICCDELSKAGLHRKLSGTELLATIGFGPSISGNVDTYPDHSAVAVAGLFQTPNFKLYCHTWEDEIAYLHFHDWNGAFQALEGESLVADYKYEERARASAKLRFGNVALTSLRRLQPGDVSTVVAGPSQVHCIGHLGKRVINISVRTPVREYLMDVYRPGLAFETSVRPSARNQNKAFASVMRTDQEFGVASLLNFVRHADLESAFHAMHTAFIELGGLEQLSECNEALRERLGDSFPIWCGAFDDLARWRLMRRLRAEVSQSDDLAILVALYIATDRSSLDDVVRRGLRAAEPVSFFDEGLCKIFTRTGLFGVRLDAPGLSLLRNMLRGSPPERAAAEAAREHQSESLAQPLAGLGRVLYANPLLRPAFSTD